MSGSAQCPHSEVDWRLNHVHLADATIRYLEITGRCAICGKPATFRGMPIGLSPDRPTMALGGDEARLPFMLGDEEPAGNLVGFVGATLA